jgi:hypothetical protein
MGPLSSGASTSQSQIELDWAALTSTNDGGATILSYGVLWDQGSSTWTELVGLSSDYPGVSYIVASGVASGTTYQFQIKAKNKWGWGAYSSVTSILAASAPSQISAAATSYDSATGGVIIAWSAPS